jgi:hypothetical protein
MAHHSSGLLSRAYKPYSLSLEASDAALAAGEFAAGAFADAARQSQQRYSTTHFQVGVSVTIGFFTSTLRVCTLAHVGIMIFSQRVPWQSVTWRVPQYLLGPGMQKSSHSTSYSQRTVTFTSGTIRQTFCTWWRHPHWEQQPSPAWANATRPIDHTIAP